MTTSWTSVGRSAAAPTSSSFQKRTGWLPRRSRTWRKAVGTASSRWVIELEPLVERREVARQQQEEGVADLMAGGGAALPAANDLVVEVPQPGAMERHVALEACPVGELRRVDRLEVADEPRLGGHVGFLGSPAQVGQPAVVGVDAQIGGVARPGLHERIEACLDERSRAASPAPRPPAPRSTGPSWPSVIGCASIGLSWRSARLRLESAPDQPL